MPKCPHCGNEMSPTMLLISESKNIFAEEKKVLKPVYLCNRCGFKKDRNEGTLHPMPSERKIAPK